MMGVGDLWDRIGQAGAGWMVSSALDWTLKVLLIGGAGWLLRVWREQALRRKAPRIIYREIDDALDDALRATGASVLTEAELLQGRVRLYLGPIFDFHSAEGKALEKLRKALEGKVKTKPVDPAAVVVLTPAGPGAAASSAAAAGGGAASAAAGGGGGMQVGVITPVQPPPPTGTDRDASTREHIVEVRGALEEFAVLWKSARVDQQLRRIQAALLITRPIGPSSTVPAWMFWRSA